MNKTLSTLLTSAILTGLMTAQTAHSEEKMQTTPQGDQMTADKNGCNGQKKTDKNSCNGQNEMKKKKKKGDKNSCKNGCGEMKTTPTDDAKKDK